MSLVKSTIIVGGIASLATTVAAALFARSERKPMTAPINAVSHIAFGDEAFDHDELSLKHTPIGIALNTMAVASWSFLLQLVLPRDKRNLTETLAKSAAVTTAAYVVDYHVVPERLTPGFEKKLSGKALFGVYATMAFAMAVASLGQKR